VTGNSNGNTNRNSKDNSNGNNQSVCALRRKMMTLHPFQGVVKSESRLHACTRLTLNHLAKSRLHMQTPCKPL
jgi:hypothetical protein